jgi:hypothetical protein
LRIAVRLREFGGRWLAGADIAGEPDIGIGMQPREAIRDALASLGEPYASELAERARLRRGR